MLGAVKLGMDGYGFVLQSDVVWRYRDELSCLVKIWNSFVLLGVMK